MCAVDASVTSEGRLGLRVRHVAGPPHARVLRSEATPSTISSSTVSAVREADVRSHGRAPIRCPGLSGSADARVTCSY